MATAPQPKPEQAPQPAQPKITLTADYQSKLYEISKVIHEAENFVKVLPYVEKEILTLMNAERLTVYQRGRHDREIVSKYKTGKDIKEIRVALSTTSIAGFVALSQRAVRIDNVYDKASLAKIHPQLRFDYSFDQRSGMRTRSMVVVPIKFKETLLGVLQIINRLDSSSFSDQELKIAHELAQVIGQKFQYDFQATQGPFEHLMHCKLLTPDKLEELKKKSAASKVSVQFLLMSELKLAVEEVGESLERYYQVPFMSFDPDINPPPELMKNLNRSYLKTHLWVPVEFKDDRATILIDDPNDFTRIMEVQQVLSANSYDFRVGIPEDILRYLGEGSTTIHEGLGMENDLSSIMGKLEGEIIQDDGDIAADSGVSENEATVVQLVNRLIIDAVKINASDIHVEPSKGKDSAVVRMRVDGQCREMLRIPSSHIRAVVARIKIMSRLDIAERRKPQDGKIGVKLAGKAIELRVATIPTVHGESAVLRVLAAGEKSLPFESLNFTPRNDREVRRLIEFPHGIFLVVGPTGSGKTTTLHALLGHINRTNLKIWTAEDPVEITQPGLQQVQVHPGIGFDFAAALRSFLRADPDVILIGEMRDKETSHIGVEASLTGHLVFSTLHTNSAPETITRLLGLELDPMDFADALLGVLAQRLLRTLCPDCKEPYSPSAEEIEQLQHMYGGPREQFAELLKSMGELKLYRPRDGGCDKCTKSGYKGRTGIHELLVASPEMKDLVARNSTIKEIRGLAVKEGMTTLMQDGILKILKGQSDIFQLRKVVAE
jgi:type II secretory ATPase GspE/PulE/Tfp pilus assembly ATPase PilB-like protein/putative methionine-R-sulfoxide reductase with GAF domain